MVFPVTHSMSEAPTQFAKRSLCAGPALGDVESRGAQAWGRQRPRDIREGFLEEGTLDLARHEGYSKEWSQRGRGGVSPAWPLGGRCVSHPAEGVRAAGEKERAGRDQNCIFWEGSQVPRPSCKYRQRPAPAAPALATAGPCHARSPATPRPSARGPRNAPPTRRHAGCRHSFRLAHPAPDSPAGRGPRARASSSPPHPSPAAPPHPMPAPRSRAPGADPAAEACPGPPPPAPTRLPGLARHKGKRQHV